MTEKGSAMKKVWPVLFWITMVAMAIVDIILIAKYHGYKHVITILRGASLIGFAWGFFVGVVYP
jgi:hypothetical protein